MNSPEFRSPSPDGIYPESKAVDDRGSPSSRLTKYHKHREYKTYDYDPLPRERGTIRLLSLFSSEKSDAGVLCELITPREDEKSQFPYEALSWCWGAAAKTDYIRIQRERKTYTKYVSPNLVAALKALRYEDRTRHLWIDMVCIDQDNLDEKNHQVEMMSVIYGNAVRVCIWLGEANDSSRMALRFIKKEVSHLQSFDTLCDSKDASKKWVALLDLMQRPWFSRRWVVQELALAQKAVIYCGNDKISWKKFAIAVELFVEVETATHRLSEVMKKDRQYRYIPSYFEFVSALGASLLVDATERLFRDYQEEGSQQTETAKITLSGISSGSASDSDSRSEHTDTDESESSTSVLTASRGRRAPRVRTRIQPLLSLEYLVSSLTIFDTSMPHDTIYALLAIAKDTTPRAVASTDAGTSGQAQDGLESYQQRKSYNVDYNLPYVDVCKDFISFLIERSLAADRSRALDIICRPWAIEERKLNGIRAEKKAAQEKRARDMKRQQERNQRKAHKGRRKTSQSPMGPKSAPEDGTTSAQKNGNISMEDSRGSNADEDDLPLPSWIPQLSNAPYAMAHRPGLTGPKMSRINADPLVGLPSLTQRNYSAAETKGIDMKILKFRKRAVLEHFSMYVRGFVLDKIEIVEQVARNGQIPREWAELSGWEGARGPPPDEFWRTLVANRGKDGKNPPVYYSRACQESFKKGGLESGAVDTTALIDYERNSVVAQFCRRVQAVTWNRAIAKKERQRLALVSRDVDKGDLVCILYGCSVPVVLRKSKLKTPEECEKEMEEELRFVANTVGKRYKQYAGRKKRHEFRKDVMMIPLCRQWLKATDWLHGKKDNLQNLTLLELLRKALVAFSEWRAERRQALWYKLQGPKGESSNAHKTAALKAGRSRRSSMLEDPFSIGWRRSSRSHGSPVTPSNLLSTRPSSLVGLPNGSNTAQKRPPDLMDWWAFEYALIAWRRWKKVVQAKRKARVEFCLVRSKADWEQEQSAKYEAFKARRRKEGTWRERETQTSEMSATETPPNERPAVSLQTLLESQHEMPDSSLTKIRPGWSRKTPQRVRFSEEEGEKYRKKILENLRERLGEDGRYSYRLLGECYIHGMMDGEAMSYQNGGKEGVDEVVPSRVFEIR